MFLLLYAFVGLFSLAQLGRIFGSLTVKKFWLMTIEYSLIAVVCMFRALNHAVYYTLYTDLSLAHQTAISGIPYLFNNWIFTLVIMAWMGIYATAAHGSKAISPFTRLIVPFTVVNSLVSLSLFGIFVAMSQADDIDTISELNRAGVIITSAVQLALAVFLCVYGLLLVTALMKTISHKPFARKLGVIAVALALSFALSSALLLYSVIDEDSFGENLLRNSGGYFGLDLVALVIVQSIFSKSLTDAIRTSRNKKNNKSSSEFGSAVDDGRSSKLHSSRTVGSSRVMTNSKLTKGSSVRTSRPIPAAAANNILHAEPELRENPALSLATPVTHNVNVRPDQFEVELAEIHVATNMIIPSDEWRSEY